VTGAEGRADCDLVHTIGAQQTKPYIGLCLTDKGSYSRVLNRRFTPVTHALMAAAAPGQLSAEELMKIRVADGLAKQRYTHSHTHTSIYTHTYTYTHTHTHTHIYTHTHTHTYTHTHIYTHTHTYINTHTYSREYFLFGTPISQSLSPSMHNKAYGVSEERRSISISIRREVGEV
jgi:hypothetical protein